MPCVTRNKDRESRAAERCARCSGIRAGEILASGFRLPPGPGTRAPGRAGADRERGEVASVLESQGGVHALRWLPFAQLEALHVARPLTPVSSASRARFGLRGWQLSHGAFEPGHDGPATWTCPTPEIRAVTVSHFLLHGPRDLGTAKCWNFSCHFLGGRLFQVRTPLPNHSLC